MADLFDTLKLKMPIWNAGMGLGIAGPALAAAVSEAGGLGVLGCGAKPAVQVSAMIDDLRRLTSRAFAVNIILPMSDGNDVAACFDAGVPAMILFWGDPQPYLADARKRGVRVISQCGSVEEAEEAAALGVDAVIIQGTEAGGHVKALEPLAQTAGVAAGVLGSVPVIASGGIANGTDLHAALSLGAKAVSIGTRFLATPEARVLDSYKDKIINAGAADTVFTDVFNIGWPDANHRVLRNDSYNEWEKAGEPVSGQRPGEGEIVAEAVSDGIRLELPRYSVYPPSWEFEGDLDGVALYAGESVERVNDIKPAATVIAEMLSDYRALL